MIVDIKYSGTTPYKLIVPAHARSSQDPVKTLKNSTDFIFYKQADKKRSEVSGLHDDL